MKIAQIKFNQPAAARVYNDYMKRVKKVTSSLPKESQDDIYMEMNSHIFEAIQHKDKLNEIDSLLDILEKLGPPEEVLKPLVADKKLEQATKTFNPVHVFKALALNITNGISYIIFAILYLFLFGFVILIIAKIVYPSEVGLYYKPNTLFVLGMGTVTKENGVHEYLGNWFIPAMVLAIAVFYILLTALLKLKKNLNKNKS
ncbi:hypothetical protein CLV59_107133 [Chitinophaga dinghuensis]|uniref:DUF1700 domain-containing protein n=1 Tax=Chitinophaga dinghuensis TaxID=1539050 RepID=A0A327VS48_9BACT|nr:hypothetical protein [Chitinophaga dinghuensis]RAJ77366.1 hypothetical protein CLV59_107133 [Chitinophaga dinghuensis]